MLISDFSKYLREIGSHKVVGVKIHNHMHDNQSSELAKEIYKEYIFCLIFDNNTEGSSCANVTGNKRKELSISVINSQIVYELRSVKNFGALTHIPIGKAEMGDLIEDEVGSHAPIPREDKLRSTNRGFDKVPLWIFRGGSGLGKSFLAHKIQDLTVFETDAWKTLPDVITEDIVVLGNKYKHTVEDITSRTRNRNVIISNFESI